MSHISYSLPHKSQYSDQILEGQLSHTHQVGHKPENKSCNTK